MSEKKWTSYNEDKYGESQEEVIASGLTLTFGDMFSTNAFWVLDTLHSLGMTKYTRERAEMEGIDFDMGLDELRSKGFLDETDPHYPTIIWRSTDEEPSDDTK